MAKKARAFFNMPNINSFIKLFRWETSKKKQVAKNNATMEALGYQSCSHSGHFENAKSLLAFIGRVDVASLGPGKTIAVL